MKATAHSPTPPAQTTVGKDHSGFWSILCAVLFVPAALAAGVLTLASERASRCLTYGQQCVSGLPSWLFNVGVGLGAVACVIVLVTSVARVRQVALATQILGECMALLVILSHV
ncbi:hypothetical protein [Streptomyces echinatus]|uniref:hypothetical protein n=1 Tax=Streptomyces echinatus TaxID=67293 RepID=UPI003820F7D4